MEQLQESFAAAVDRETDGTPLPSLPGPSLHCSSRPHPYTRKFIHEFLLLHAVQSPVKRLMIERVCFA